MRSLEAKEKHQKALEPEKTQKKTWASSSTTTTSAIWKGVSQGSIKWERFPQTNCKHHFGETSILKEVVYQNIKVRPLPLSTVSPHTLADIHPHLSAWEWITSDSVIREGITIDFLKLPHCSNSMPLCNVSFGQRDAITGAINQLLTLGVISEATYHTDKYVSSVFATERPNRSLSMILNLKQFNEFVHHVHFKMESLQDVICLIQPGVWMWSADLKDAYYSVQVHHLYKKFFTFYWHGRFYEYNRMPYGYALRLHYCSQKSWSNLSLHCRDRVCCQWCIWMILTSKGTRTLVVSKIFMPQLVNWLTWVSKLTMKNRCWLLPRPYASWVLFWIQSRWLSP